MYIIVYQKFQIAGYFQNRPKAEMRVSAMRFGCAAGSQCERSIVPLPADRANHRSRSCALGVFSHRILGIWQITLTIPEKPMVEGSLEVKLPTIWTVEKQR